MKTETNSKYVIVILSFLLTTSCNQKHDQQFADEIKAINLKEGDIALCGSVKNGFGKVDFETSCLDKVKDNFNLGTALLHSFEYDEAEKAFAKVIDQDPECVMAYWGVAMSNFHTLWALHDKPDLEKGYKTVALARSLEKKSAREADYLEAIGSFYDDWDKLDHKTRALKFEKAMGDLSEKYPEDKEAAIFYALALDATADPADKSFRNQRKAGEILNKIYAVEPNHPGIAHYIIHNYDYPELASLALPAARAYASIAPASAHAQHMPSHIFTRLGLWDESIQSNLQSISAAQCYASNVGMKTRWDEEFHGMDYLVYAYLQEGKDDQAKEQNDLVKALGGSVVKSGKSAYVLAAIPARYALERKQWKDAANLEVAPKDFPWETFPWEKAITHFARALGCVHTKRIDQAKKELEVLHSIHKNLLDAKETYKANQVQIQINAAAGWIQLAQGQTNEALKLMTLAADMEDATAKSPVTPGEIIPARELLGDMLVESGEPAKALEAYESDLARHPNRFNGLCGAGMAAQKSRNGAKAVSYYTQLVTLASPDNCKRPELQEAARFLLKNKIQ